MSYLFFLLIRAYKGLYRLILTTPAPTATKRTGRTGRTTAPATISPAPTALALLSYHSKDFFSKDF